ncbi:MAG: hypothetical protein R2799_15090, partial [Crocinitomicaceae bacterium]
WTVTYDMQRTVKATKRLNELSQTRDTIIPIPKIDYPLISLRRETSFQLQNIEPAKIKLFQNNPKLYKHYLKVGIGSYITPLVQYNFNSGRSRKSNWGVNIDHVSSWLNMKGWAPSTTDNTGARIYGTLLQNKYQLTGSLDFHNKGFHYYGIPDENVPGDSINGRFNNIDLNAEWRTANQDSAKHNFKVGIQYFNYFSFKRKSDTLAKRNGRENFAGLYTGYWYKLKTETFGLDLDARYDNYKFGDTDTLMQPDSVMGLKNNNTIINFKPYVISRGKKYYVKVGLDMAFDIRSKLKFDIFPNVEFAYSMINHTFTPYIGVNGKLKQNNFRNLTQENQYILLSHQQINEATVFDAYLGFRGHITKEMTFNIMGSFARVRNMNLYVNDTTYTLGNQFDVVYDTAYIAHVNASLGYQLGEKLRIDVVGDYFYYIMNNEAYAWNRPDYRIMLSGKYNLSHKLIVGLDLTMEGGRKAKLLTTDPNTLDKNGMKYKKLGFLADLNLNVEYRWNKRISTFLNLNNLAFQKYQLWDQYRVQGFQAMLGATFSF